MHEVKKTWKQTNRRTDLCDAAKEGEGERSLDVVMSIDGRSNGADDARTNAFITAQFSTFAHILLRQPKLNSNAHFRVTSV
jgi:hypothetical protein